MNKNVYLENIQGSIMGTDGIHNIRNVDIKDHCFIKADEQKFYSSFKFPSKTFKEKDKQIQEQNYDYFLHTMAEMVQKYAPDVLV